MVSLTYGNAGVTSVETAADTAGRPETAAPRASWLARFFDAMMQARMQQAQREIRLYTRLIPPAPGDAPRTKAEAKDVPFGGW